MKYKIPPKPDSSDDIKYLFRLLNPQLKTVIDIGCGWGQDSIFMASKGIKVDAIDIKLSNPKLKQSDSITFIKSALENFNFSKRYDLMNFQLVSHYIKKDKLNKFFEDLPKILNKNGYFVAVILGTKDDWNDSDPNGAFYDKFELLEHFSDFKIWRFYEREQISATYNKTFKFWHQFGIVAQKVSK